MQTAIALISETTVPIKQENISEKRSERGSSMVFLDTDLIVNILRPLGKNPKTRATREKARNLLVTLHEANVQLKLTVFNLIELYRGAYLSRHVAKELKAVEDFLSQLILVFPSLGSAKECARVSAEFKLKGLSIGAYDLLIGGIVLDENDEIYTRNVRHFEKIPNLKYVNWELVEN